MATQIHFKAAKMLLPPMLIAVSSWGLWDLMRTEADMPTAFALLIVAGFDLCAIGFACLSLESSTDGYPPLPWNLMIWALTITSAVIQFFHGWGQGWAWYACMAMTVFPICGVLFITGHLRLNHRRRMTELGRDISSRATVSPWVWAFDRPLAIHLTRESVLGPYRTEERPVIEAVQVATRTELPSVEDHAVLSEPVEEPIQLSAVPDEQPRQKALSGMSKRVKELVDAGHTNIDLVVATLETELDQEVNRQSVGRLIRRFKPKEVAA